MSKGSPRISVSKRYRFDNSTKSVILFITSKDESFDMIELSVDVTYLMEKLTNLRFHWPNCSGCKIIISP